MRVSLRALGPLLVVLAAVLLVGGLLVLRETSDEDTIEDYCAEVEDRRAEIGAAISAGPTTGLIRALPSFEALAERAPDDIRDEWAVVTTRIQDLLDAFEAAGVDPSTYDREKPPSDVSAEDQEAIETAAVRLGSQETRTALAGVDQQARDVCHTPLSL